MVAELVAQVIQETHENVAVRGAISRRLVVELPADHRGIVFVVFHHIANHAFAIKAVNGTIRVHVLAHAVEGLGPAQRPRQNFRMLRDKARWESSKWVFP